MPEPLPPLSALRAFEAAVRHLNFTRAAKELGMTQAAISYQIKILEERLSVQLFLREGRQIALSDAGQQLAPGILEAFDKMRDSISAIRTASRQALAISCSLTFSAHWLAHRLGEFQIAHPGMAVTFMGSSSVIDFATEPFDVAIRSGKGVWPGTEAKHLLRVGFTPMMTPDVAARLRTPSDIRNVTIINPRDPDHWWEAWLQKAGIDDGFLGDLPGLSIDSQTTTATMALAGKGAALLTPALFQRELASGQLVQPFDIVADADFSYWLVYPETRRNAPAIKAFRDWILAQLE